MRWRWPRPHSKVGSSSLCPVAPMGQHLELWLCFCTLCLHLMMLCLPCTAAYMGSQAESWFEDLDPKCSWPALASVSDPGQIYASHPLHTTGLGSKSATVPDPWLFINTKRNNFLCSGFRETPPSDISDLLLCDLHSLINISQLCVNHSFFDRSAEPLWAFRGGRRHRTLSSTVLPARGSRQCSCRQVLQQHDRCLSADPSWILVKRSYRCGGPGEPQMASGHTGKGAAPCGAVRPWEGEPLGTAGSASTLLCAKSICRELNPPLEGIKDFINPWVKAGDEFHCRNTACHFEKGKLTQA